MPKRLDEQLISKIEEVYLKDETETYSSLAERFSVGKSTLERIGKERNWARKRDQQKARRAQKLIKQSEIVTQSLERVNPDTLMELDQFSQKRLLKIVERGLIVFENAIEQSSKNPRVLSSLASGLVKLVDIHLKLEPLTAADLVEILIRLDVGPDEFLSQLRQEQQRKLSSFQN